MFRKILLSAGAAGVAAALVLTLLQLVWITPLILKAEVFEDAAAAQHHEEASQHHEESEDEASDSPEHTNAAHTHEHSHANQHHHDADEWKPNDGWQRTSFTLISNIVMGVGYALMLAGVYTLWQQPKNIAQGLLFGLAGFAVFFAAPSVGLHPELPGTEAADLGQRQTWWISTAASTAVALTLIFVQKNWLLRALGVVALVIPHIVGAPHPAAEGSLAPAELQTQFRLAIVICNAVFWLTLGAVSAITWRKFSEPQTISESLQTVN